MPLRRRAFVATGWALAGLLVPLAVAQAAPPAAKGVYSCVNAQGKRITSDRPIAECIDREQRVLGADGTVKRVVPPSLTAEERTAQEARERELAAQRAEALDAARRDRNLQSRYPNEAAHRKAREAALDDVRNAIALSERRLQALSAERKPLADEAEFYVGKKWPLKLRQQMDANDAATEAQRNLIANQQAELVRINGRFDVELERLKKLWAGAAPGSLGPLPQAPGAATAASAVPAAAASAAR